MGGVQNMLRVLRAVVLERWSPAGSISITWGLSQNSDCWAPLENSVSETVEVEPSDLYFKQSSP